MEKMYKLSEEHKKKISDSMTGRVLSKEHKKKIGLKSKELWSTQEYRKNVINSLIGKKYPKELYPNHGTRNKTFPKDKYPNYGMSNKVGWKKGLSKEELLKHFENGIPKPTLGKHWQMTKKAKENISKARKNFIKEHPEIEKRNIQIRACSNKKNWSNPLWAKQQHEKMLKGLMKRPTSFEQKVIYLNDKYSFHFKYVGNGQVTIENLNPDFIDCDGKKLIIEVYFSHFKKFKCSIEEYEKERTKIFAKIGYRTLFLNESDLLRPDWEIWCSNKIQNFIKDDGT